MRISNDGGAFVSKFSLHTGRPPQPIKADKHDIANRLKVAFNTMQSLMDL